MIQHHEEMRVTNELSEILPIMAKYEVQFHNDGMGNETS